MKHEYASISVAGHQARNPLGGHLLLAEFLHRSANDLAVACAEAHIAARQPTLNSARNRLKLLRDRLHSLAAIQRLLQPPTEAVMDLEKQLCDLCHHHARARFAEQGAFVHLHADTIRVDAGRGWILVMIVSELLTNAARHAFPAPGGVVRVDAALIGNDVVCWVRDDGVGGASDETAAGSGSLIISALARQADIKMKNHPCAQGTRIELRMPTGEDRR